MYKAKKKKNNKPKQDTYKNIAFYILHITGSQLTVGK